MSNQIIQCDYSENTINGTYIPIGEVDIKSNKFLAMNTSGILMTLGFGFNDGSGGTQAVLNLLGVVFTAVQRGVMGNNISIAYADPGIDSSPAFLQFDTPTDISYFLATSNNSIAQAFFGPITATAEVSGDPGNGIQIISLYTGVPDTPFDVSVVDTEITVTLGIDADGNSISTWQDIEDGMNGNPDCFNLVSVAGGSPDLAEEWGTVETSGGGPYSITSDSVSAVNDFMNDPTASELVIATTDDSYLLEGAGPENLQGGTDHGVTNTTDICQLPDRKTSIIQLPTEDYLPIGSLLALKTVDPLAGETQGFGVVTLLS